ncbi:MAG: hypothetical protein JWO65_2544 [Sphingomonas bacterium]|nr:hypothetical protein [Sphingomonas bacterium]
MTGGGWLEPSGALRDDAAMSDSMDDQMIDTPDGPMRWADWKKKNPVQLPSRRTKGKNLPNKIKQRTDEP